MLEGVVAETPAHGGAGVGELATALVDADLEVCVLETLTPVNVASIGFFSFVSWCFLSMYRGWGCSVALLSVAIISLL